MKYCPVTKDNLHLATDLEKIQNLMRNAKRLGNTEVAEHCELRITELSTPVIQNALDIDYNFWKTKNTFFSDKEFIKGSTGAIGLVHAEKGGLIKRSDFKTSNELVEEIKFQINTANITEASDNELLRIFDLIQGWGGQNNRQPYLPKSQRMSQPGLFAQSYQNLIQNLLDHANNKAYDKKACDGLEADSDAMKEISIKFTSKHFFFWSKYKDCKLRFYIYDSRMEALCRAIFGKKLTYFEFLLHLGFVDKKYDLKQGDAERGLFAFSDNFFGNDNKLLKLKDDSKLNKEKRFLKDKSIAERIAT